MGGSFLILLRDEKRYLINYKEDQCRKNLSLHKKVNTLKFSMNYIQQENTSDIRIQGKSKKILPTWRQQFSGALSTRGRKGKKPPVCIRKEASIVIIHIGIAWWNSEETSQELLEMRA